MVMKKAMKKAMKKSSMKAMKKSSMKRASTSSAASASAAGKPEEVKKYVKKLNKAGTPIDYAPAYRAVKSAEKRDSIRAVCQRWKNNN